MKVSEVFIYLHTLTGSEQTLNQHITSTSFSFAGVDGGVPVSVICEASDGGYAFSPPSLSWNNLKSDHTGENITGYSSDTSVPIASFVMVPPAVSEDSSVSFSWIGEDDVSAPANLMYQYKLDGVDADWSLWTLGMSRLYDLANGEYTFWVRAKDEAENINQAPINYSFAVNAAPQVISAERINRSIWASQVTLEMPVGASNPTDSFILLSEHSGMSDSELIPVTIHSANDPCACGANENVAGQLGLTASITAVKSGWLVTLPESIPSGQTVQYDIVWGKTIYFGWREFITLPNGFPNGGTPQSEIYLDDNLYVWRSATKLDDQGTPLSCDNHAWIFMDICDHAEIIKDETVLRFVPGECWGGDTGGSAVFHWPSILKSGANLCYLWNDHKYIWDGATDFDYRRYGLQIFDSTGNTVNSLDGTYYDRTYFALPTQLVHNSIWILAEESGATDSAWFLVLDENGNEIIPKTVLDTISMNSSGVSVTQAQPLGTNVAFLWERSWETSGGYERQEIAYQVRNSSGSVVKAKTILSQALLSDSVEEEDEYNIDSILSDNEGKVWISYYRYSYDQGGEIGHFYSILGTDGNVWKGPIATTPNQRSFRFCDKDGNIWGTENGQFMVLNPDDTIAVSPRPLSWIPDQAVNDIAADVSSTGYRLFDRRSFQDIAVDVPSGVEPDTMSLFDLNLWNNDLHSADIDLKKDSSTVWSHSGQFTGYTDVDVSGVLDEGLNILTMTQEDFLGGQILITFPYLIPKNLTITSGRGGSVITPGEGVFQYPEGSVVDIAASPEEGYQFFGWTGTAVAAEEVAYPKEYSTRVSVNADYDLKANFSILGDFTGDGFVNLQDFENMVPWWLQFGPEDPWIDINDDDVVDIFDLAMFSSQWLNIEYVKIHDFPLGIDPQWAVQGEWAFGQPAGAGGSSYGNPDPTHGYTGDDVYGVNLNGDYSTLVGGPYYLTVGPLDCAGYLNVVLRFARWLNTDAPGYADSKIEVSNDGTNWSVVWDNPGASSISDDSWQSIEYDISDTADNQSTVYLRWSYEIKDSRTNPYSGWNIDDVQLWGNDFRLPEFSLDVDPGWMTEGQWEYGQPSGLGGGAYGNPDPSTGYDGDNVYGVNLSGDYSTSVGGPYYLTAGSIDCTGYHNVSLQFARWLNADAPGYVSSSVEVSNNGTDWTTIWQHTGSSDITDSDWQLIPYDISSVADNQPSVYIRWGYEVIDSHAYPYSGWNIDEVRLIGDR